jgi:hypothetical protein
MFLHLLYQHPNRSISIHSMMMTRSLFPWRRLHRLGLHLPLRLVFRHVLRPRHRLLLHRGHPFRLRA